MRPWIGWIWPSLSWVAARFTPAGDTGQHRLTETKCHLLVDRHAVPLAPHLTAARAHDSRAAVPTLKRLRVWRKRRHEGLAADSAYAAHLFRRWLQCRSIRASIPKRQHRRRRRRGRPPQQIPELGLLRWVVERTFSWLNNCFRHLTVRYERLPSTYCALCTLACIMICLPSSLSASE